MERSTVIGKNWLIVRRSLSEGRTFSKGRWTRTGRGQKGFSLLELMIAMFILIILLSVALPAYQRTVQHARETVLKENLWQMRRAIDQYKADKQKLPQSIKELVDEKYLHEVPMDPITEKREWNEVAGEDNLTPDGGQGMVNVKSLAEGTDSNGNAFESEEY
jgi:general secretion pathway protein G